MIHHFMTQNLDAVFVATNAPGRSAFNRIERRMAPLSRELSGLIVDHAHYASHLDSQNRTVDTDLEKKNFEFAGTTLAEVWSSLTFDKYEVIAEYVKPECSEINEEELPIITSQWFTTHVSSSQYFLQILKCNDLLCCSAPRSSLFSLGIKDHFLPAPIPIAQTEDGIKALVASSVTEHSFPSIFVRNGLVLDEMLPLSLHQYRNKIPYDLFCPSVTENIKSKICNFCGLYYPSQTMLKNCHILIHKDKGDTILFEKPKPKNPKGIEMKKSDQTDEPMNDI
jgi:hypothetical protein